MRVVEEEGVEAGCSRLVLLVDGRVDVIEEFVADADAVAGGRSG